MNFNIDKVIGQAIHKPQRKSNKEPLYLRLEENGNIYSSPTNLRAIVVSGEMTLTKTWLNPNGVSTNVFISTPVVDGKDDKYTLSEIKELLMSYNQRRMEYANAKANGIDAEEPEKITINGTGLKCITNPLVCNNIETVVFTNDIMISSNLSGDRIIGSLLNGNKLTENNEAVVKTLFKTLAGLSSIQDIPKRFPLLKRIIYISNLGMGLDRDGNVKLAKALLSNKINKVTLEKIATSYGIENYSMAEIKVYQDRLDVREGIYKFDEKLRGVKIASIEKEDTPQESEQTENNGSKESRIIENTIKLGINDSDSEEEKNSRLDFYKIALKSDYGSEKTTNIIKGFRDDELRDYMLN